MNEPAKTNWLTLTEAAEYVGVRKGGRCTSHYTVRAWVNGGLGGIRLKSQLRGGMRYTTAAWIEEFFAAFDRQREAERERRRTKMRSPAAAKRAQEKARRELEAAGAR